MSLVYSFSEDEIGHGKFEELIKQEFRKQRIEPIFDRFYKSDEFEQGSGLGLPICKIIVEKLSGRLGVSSEVGEDSCFSVYLPLADA
ncbi:ATP-binding protein [Bacteroides caccae]|uniref:ATP-binding protein n=1 Tax=Bacteroides caccae TaxID=47678 RepID=UPI0012311A08|nr:ATP-binding protein [Bacteroides caccae]KAA5449891.1 HAMP domain-containing histidine kinase [Bacteroides caccae]KAA5454357.1 HAMP domain-containing histidine kinase [Bacteroides caccae]KAA5460887.1 HAMP domain-containing histidine kinase [Bacteroides caccae]KAA5475724.1 HAMP domain-containing histidine kinase [Bacteroides caccae]